MSPDFGPVVDQNSFYGYGPGGIGMVYETAHRAWRHRPPNRAWMQEGTYEYENNLGHFSAEPWDTRRARFWAVLAGGTAGDGFGSKEGVVVARHLRGRSPHLALTTHDTHSSSSPRFRGGSWRRPERNPGSPASTWCRLGRGTWGQLDFITAAVTSKHDWLLAYVPVMKRGARTFTIDMAAMAGWARARWFDPATGNYIAISDGYDYPTPGRETSPRLDAAMTAQTTGCWSWTRPVRLARLDHDIGALHAPSRRPIGSFLRRHRDARVQPFSDGAGRPDLPDAIVTTITPRHQTRFFRSPSPTTTTISVEICSGRAWRPAAT